MLKIDKNNYTLNTWGTIQTPNDTIPTILQSRMPKHLFQPFTIKIVLFQDFSQFLVESNKPLQLSFQAQYNLCCCHSRTNGTSFSCFYSELYLVTPNPRVFRQLDVLGKSLKRGILTYKLSVFTKMMTLQLQYENIPHVLSAKFSFD